MSGVDRGRRLTRLGLVTAGAMLMQACAPSTSPAANNNPDGNAVMGVVHLAPSSNTKAAETSTAQ